MTNVRVRFAPSPTGALHIGGIRTALFNYLFAKQHHGVFYLRIEDTDQTRYEPKAEQYIMDALDWLGISPDETVNKNEKFGPYRQSERKDIYKKYINQLLETGYAYYAFDTAESLEHERQKAEADKKTFVYNHTTRPQMLNSVSLSEDHVVQKLAANLPFVIRFKNPDHETLHLKDIIRGDVRFETSLLDDKILYKSDGMPTYHFANVVDDHLMQTSHVIRGEEWLPSLPLHYMLYRAFGWTTPEFAHLPLILKPVGNGKLSKRDGDKLGFPVFPLAWENSVGYKDQGFFPEAVINFLAMLGWNDGTEQELFSITDLVEKFDLQKVHKSGAKFDPEKNKWFNHQYLQSKANEDLAPDFLSLLKNKGFDIDIKIVVKIISLIKERTNFVTDFWELSSYLFEAPNTYDEKASKNWNDTSAHYLKEILKILPEITNFKSSEIEIAIKNWATNNEINIGKVMQPLRLSLVGSLKGIAVFDIIEIIGIENTTNRINTAIQTIKAN